MRLRPALLVCVLVCMTLTSTRANAKKLRVKGAAVIDARAVVLPDGFEIRGAVKDDAGRALGPTHVRIRIADAAGGAPLRLPKATLCPPSPDVHEARGFRDLPDEYVLDTNGAGAFCVRVNAAGVNASIELSVEATRDYDGARSSVELNTGKRALLLQFAPEPRNMPLDQGAQMLSVDTRVQPQEPPNAEVVPLALSLVERDGPTRQREIGQTMVTTGDMARFELSPAQLGRPGPARLRVHFAGSPTLGPATREAFIERTARAEISLPRTLPEIDPARGFELDVHVSSAVGPVPSGAVEVLVGDETVATAAVRDGLAHVVAEFEVPHATTLPVLLRYLPGAPWWLPGAPVQASLKVAPPSRFRRVFWIITAVALAAWVVRSWRRPAPVVREVEHAEPLPTGRASVDVIEIGAERSGWRGRVVDAHDGTPIADARLALVVPSFAGASDGPTAVTDDQGRFTLEYSDGVHREGARLQVSAAWHSALDRHVPPQGQVVVQLVSRRRAVLERLVGWARKRGRPWMDAVEPTPGQIAHTARAKGDAAAEHWAAQIEDAAYGASPPDAGRERSIADNEPA